MIQDEDGPIDESKFAMTHPTQAQINFGTPTDDIERAAHDWLTKHLCLEGEAVMQSLADLIRQFALRKLMRTSAPWETAPTKAQTGLIKNMRLRIEELLKDKAALTAAAGVKREARITKLEYDEALDDIRKATIERCAQVAENFCTDELDEDAGTARLIAAAIRALKGD